MSDLFWYALDRSAQAFAAMLWPSYADHGMEGAAMSRRRTGSRYVPITISLKPSMVDDIEAVLNAKQSRSEWIAGAIEQKLDGDGLLIRDASNVQLKLALHARICGCHKTADCLVMRDLRRLRPES